CGRCGHACGGQNCAAGRCEPRAETTDNPGGTLVVLGADGKEIYYFLAEEQLGGSTDGGARLLVDFQPLYQAQDGGNGKADYCGGAGAGSPTDLFIHTKRLLFRRDAGGGIKQLAGGLPTDDAELQWFAATSTRFAYTTRAELVLIDKKGLAT